MAALSCSSVYDVSYDYNTKIDLNRLKSYDWLRVPEKEGIKDLDVVRIKDAVSSELEAKGLMRATDNPDFLIAVYIEKKDKVNITGPGYGLYPEYYGYGPYRGYRGYGPHLGYRGYGPYGGYRGYGPQPGYRGYGPYRGYRGYVPHRGHYKHRPYPDYRRPGPYRELGRYGPYPYYQRYGGIRVTKYEEGTLILDFIDPEVNEVIWQGTAKSYVDDSMVTEKRELLIYDAVQKILVNFPPAT